MSIVLTLPPELETHITTKASENGLSVSDYILQLLKDELNGKPHVRTGTDLVSYWQQEGLIGSRSDITDPSEHARTVRKQVESRK